MIALAVGEFSFQGRSQKLLQAEDEDNTTPLQKKLETVAEQIGLIGVFAAILTVMALFGRLFIGDIWMGDEV